MTRRSVRVLLVEDNVAELRLLSELLQGCDDCYEVQSAPLLAEALVLARTKPPDVMLLDLSLPDVAGLDALRRALAATGHLPIIVLTDPADRAAAGQAVAEGAQDCLVKGDIDAALLERSIRHGIGRSGKHRALAQSEERYALAVQGAGDGLWDWTLAPSRRAHYSDRYQSLLGYEAPELGSSPEQWFDRVHPDEVGQVRGALEAHLDGRSPAFEQEHRLRHRDGSYRRVLTRGAALRDSRGRPYRIAGLLTDITDRGGPDPAQPQLVEAWQGLLKELRRGLERREFAMHYQPIVWLESGEVAGFEALLRWQHPERGLLLPRDFLDVALGHGLLEPIFEQVLPDVLRQVKSWQREHRRASPLFVNVNLAGSQLASADLPDLLGGALSTYDLPGFTLGVEVTEQLLHQADEGLLSRLKALKDRQIRLLLDDFGTGLSSLSCLQRFPLDNLKIDRSILADLTAGSEFLRAIITVAHSMGMAVTAEGIESPEQLRFLSALSCELGQGYYFSRPVAPDLAGRAISSGYAPAGPAPVVGARRWEPKPSTAGRVLVVDDDRANRRLMGLQLEEADFEVIVAATGEECLGIAAKTALDVILLDIEMPGMDGIETCRRLKASVETSMIPVLFITGHRQDDPTTVEALKAGGNDFLSKDAPVPILCARLASQVVISRAQAKLRRVAMTDELTGVFTRRFLFDALRRTLKQSTRRKSTGIACLLADIDHFKQINDCFGHLEGDRRLAAIARIIEDNTRETDLVARFGGEEFVVVLPSTDAPGARKVAEKIRCAVAEGSNGSTISIGGASFDQLQVQALKESGNIDSLIERLLKAADDAMYEAKKRGRNRVVMCEQPLSREQP